MPRRIFRKLEFLRNLKGLLGAFLMRVRLISVFKLVFSKTEKIIVPVNLRHFKNMCNSKM